MYASYLLNVLCNDEKALSLACKIIIHEYKSNRMELDDGFYNIIVDKLQYEIKKKHDLEIVWLIYLLKYTDFSITQELLKKIVESKCDLAIIVIIEEWSEMIDATDIEWCWENFTINYLKKIILSIKNFEKICKKRRNRKIDLSEH